MTLVTRDGEKVSTSRAALRQQGSWANPYPDENPAIGLAAWEHEQRNPHGEWVSGTGMLDLYHHTTPQSAAVIRSSGRFTSPERDEHGRPIAFFTTDPGQGSQAGGRGSGVVHIRVPEGLARLEDEFPSGEQHYSIPVSQIRPEHIQPENTGLTSGDPQFSQDIDRIRSTLRSLAENRENTAVRDALLRTSDALGRENKDEALMSIADASAITRKYGGNHQVPKAQVKQYQELARDIQAAFNGRDARLKKSNAQGGEKYPGEFNDSILRFWRNEPDPKAKDALNKAAGSWEADDVAGAVQFLRTAAQHALASPTDTGKEDNATRSFNYRELAARIATSAEQAMGTKAEVRKYIEQAAPLVPGLLGGGHEEWDGQSPDLFDQYERPGLLAEVDWNGHMKVQQQVAEQIERSITYGQPIDNPDAFTVPLHELIHGVIGGREVAQQKARDAIGMRQPVPRERYQDHMRAYQEPAVADIEEGFTELGSIQHAPEFFDQMGIGDRPTPYTGKENPEHDRKMGLLHDDLNGVIAKLQDPSFPHDQATARQIAFKLQAAATDAKIGILDSEDATAVNLLQHAGWPEFSGDVARLTGELADAMGTPIMSRKTMSEYAREIQDPARILSRDGGMTWGHYPNQAADAQEWVQEVAKAEGFGDVRPGTPGYKRTVELADEINRDGPAGKVEAMANQVLRAEDKNGVLADNPMARATARQAIIAEIMKEFGDVASSGKSAFISAHHAARVAVTQAAAERSA